MRKIVAVIHFFLFRSFLPAQEQLADSLWRQFALEKDPLRKVDLLNRLSEAYLGFSVPRALSSAHEALRQAQDIQYQTGIFYACNNLGLSHDTNARNDSAYYFYKKAINLAEAQGDPYKLAIIRNNLGIFYLKSGNYPIALQYLQKALEDSDQPDYVLDPMEVYANIGIVHEELGDEEKAIAYYRLSAEAATQKGDSLNLAYAGLNYGYIAFLQKDFGEAHRQYEQSLAYYRQENLRSRIAETLYYIALVCKAEGKYECALDYHRQALKIYEEDGQRENIPSMYSAMAEVFEKSGSSKKAIDLLHRAAALAEAYEQPTELVNVYESLAQCYATLNNYQNAYQYQLLYQQLNDSIYNRETKDKIKLLEINFELNVKEAENQKLRAEQDRNTANLQRRTLLAFGSGLIAILVSVIAILLFRANRQKSQLARSLEEKIRSRTAALESANDRLSQSNEELERFTYIASHDLKEPLRNITSFVNLMQRKLKDHNDQDLHEYMEFVTSNSRQMYFLIEDILAFSQVAGFNLRRSEPVDLNQTLDKIRYALKNTIAEKNILISSTKLPVLNAHEVFLYLLLKNLIENGIKYNDAPQPCIEICYRETTDDHLFSIRDNGIGIDPAYHEQIFDMFKRLNHRGKYTGSGIGLAVCKKIVQKYGGEIWIESEEGKGSTFSFNLPKSMPQ